MTTSVTTYYLEMTSPAQLKGKYDANGLLVMEAEIKQYQVNRFFYQFVGKVWQWTDKLAWTDARWEAYAERDEIRLWAAYYKGAPAGYFELEKRSRNGVNLAYFGLAGPFIGRGFGGYLLTQALENAWRWGEPERVTVNTCTLDHPSALRNYQSRGFVIYDQVVSQYER